MKVKRSNSGFTMMEVLIVGSIIIALAAVAFIAVQNHQRSMKQLELDKTAREIFIAAQNHLTMEESMGRLEKFSQTKDDATEAERTANEAKVGYLKSYKTTNKEGKEERRTVNLFFVSPQEDGAADTKLTSDTVLRAMLPKFSLDDTVRVGGSYIIEYDLNTAKVLSVFYSDLSKPLSDHKFAEGDFENLFPAYYGTDAGGKRKDGYGDNKAILGWYGGDDLEGIDLAKLYSPDIEIINAECLEVKVKLSNTAIYHMTQKEDTGAVLQVIMKGLTSGAERQVFKDDVSKSIAWTGTEIDTTNTYRYKTVILDDITASGQQFANRWCETTPGSTDEPFIPGEDVELYAVVYSNKRLANLAESAHKQTNSLFAEIKTIGGVKTANISNIRHLENIDKTISNYDPANFKDKAGATNGATSFVQIADLQWAGDGSKTSSAFRDKIYHNEARAYADYTSANMVRVYNHNNTPTKDGTYAPVNPDFKITYAGETGADRAKRISNVIVDTNANAGVFGTISTGLSVSDLELLDFNIKTSNGSAGTLAGSITGTTVTNVHAYNSQSDDGKKEIVASGAAGGLVGSVTGTTGGADALALTGNAAAVYVRSTAGSAGGLLGSTSENVKIDNSYAAGHTKEGLYLAESTAETVGRYNVQASTEAGGLVGNASGALTISNSYATTSVIGNTAGGFVGKTTGGSINNCYATGLVAGTTNDANKGTFVGLANNVESTNNTYYSIVNPGVLAVGTGSAENITAFDEDIDTYKTYIKDHESPTATPYDSTLTTRYNNVYPFKTVAELNPEAKTVSIANSHVGDWPSMETMVVNTKTSS